MKKIPYIDLSITEEEYEKEISPYLKEIFMRGDFVGGRAVAEFEKAFAGLCGCRYAVSVNSGTDALEMALEAKGVSTGDEVITVGNSFIATTNAISRVGAIPVLADIGYDLLIDANDIEHRITDKTKAILPVHLTGLVCDMDKINSIAQKHGLIVIEDAAQSAGAVYKDRKSGNTGDIGCFSLHPLKNLAGIGDGGMITTNDEMVYNKLTSMRNHGMQDRDNQAFIGRVSRLDSLNASILKNRIINLDEIISNRIKSAEIYDSILKNIKEIRIFPKYSYRTHTYHVYVIQAERRTELMQFLDENGIDTKIHYPVPAHRQHPFAGRAENIPVTDKLSERILSLPIWLTEEDDLRYIAEKIAEFYKSS